MKIWHYTTKNHIQKIISSGAIVPATANVPKWERPAVWLTSSPSWEPTATKAVRLPDGTARKMTSDELLKYGPCRIQVVPGVYLHPWTAKTQKKMRMASDWIRPLESESGSNPKDWYVSFTPIPKNKWITIEIYDGSLWREM